MALPIQLGCGLHYDRLVVSLPPEDSKQFSKLMVGFLDFCGFLALLRPCNNNLVQSGVELGFQSIILGWASVAGLELVAVTVSCLILHGCLGLILSLHISLSHLLKT